MPVIDEGECSGWNRTSKCLLLLKMLALGYLSINFLLNKVNS